MKATIGRIVIVEKADGGIIANGAREAVAIVTQPFEGGVCNLTMFAPGLPPEDIWSAYPKDKAPTTAGYTGYYWSWPKREG
ncbi:MAG: hypothetical protein RLZZ200_835 [Pseudomonadota bacterium]|jgi:hypothetical protein